MASTSGAARQGEPIGAPSWAVRRGKNRCVARRFNERLRLNTYDNWNLLEERDALGDQSARYVHGRRIDEIVQLANRHGTFSPHHDVLGNVTMLTDVTGSIVERYAYSVEGKVTVFDGAGAELPESAIGNRWMFTGREWLAEVGLYDYRNRVYSAELGRFLQTDPIQFHAKDINIYRYSASNYINWPDPLGLDYGWTYNPTYGAISPFNDTGFYEMTEYEQLSAFGNAGGNTENTVAEIVEYEENFQTALDHFQTQMDWLNAYHENSGAGVFDDYLTENFGPMAGAVDFGFELITAATTIPGYVEAVGDFVENSATVIADKIGGWWDSMWE